MRLQAMSVVEFYISFTHLSCREQVVFTPTAGAEGRSLRSRSSPRASQLWNDPGAALSTEPGLFTFAPSFDTLGSNQPFNTITALELWRCTEGRSSVWPAGLWLINKVSHTGFSLKIRARHFKIKARLKLLQNVADVVKNCIVIWANKLMLKIAN